METPFFLIDKKKLEHNVQSFEIALKKIWANSRIAYSVKTNSLPWLLKFFQEKNVMAEVVSDEEYELAILCGFKEDEIVFNGPIKGERTFIESIRKGSIVNIDSKNELQIFKREIKRSIETIGVRVNVDSTVFDPEDIRYSEDGFRFGFSDKECDLFNAIDELRLGKSENKIGLHFHCNSDTRSLSVYRKIAEYAKLIIEKYDITPSYIDIGGGFFGGVEGKPTAIDYISTIYNVLKNVINVNTTQLIIEPGSALIGSAVEFHTSVLDKKDNNKTRIITTDGSRVNIDPLWSKKSYLYRIEKFDPIDTITNSNINTRINKQVICGYTCMDHDRIMTLMNLDAIDIGDRIVYEKVGAYTMTFGGPFIKYYPDVYVKNDNRIEHIRKKMDTKNYYKIHTEFL